MAARLAFALVASQNCCQSLAATEFIMEMTILAPSRNAMADVGKFQIIVELHAVEMFVRNKPRAKFAILAVSLFLFWKTFKAAPIYSLASSGFSGSAQAGPTYPLGNTDQTPQTASYSGPEGQAAASVGVPTESPAQAGGERSL